MRSCGVVRPPVRAVMASHSGVSPLTKISRTSTPLRSSKAFARWHQGHGDWAYISTSAGIRAFLSYNEPSHCLRDGCSQDDCSLSKRRFEPLQRCPSYPGRLSLHSTEAVMQSTNSEYNLAQAHTHRRRKETHPCRHTSRAGSAGSDSVS